jgi:hypothetical protein
MLLLLAPLQASILVFNMLPHLVLLPRSMLLLR